jgi:hypothetical protein
MCLASSGRFAGNCVLDIFFEAILGLMILITYICILLLLLVGKGGLGLLRQAV